MRASLSLQKAYGSTIMLTTTICDSMFRHSSNMKVTKQFQYQEQILFLCIEIFSLISKYQQSPTHKHNNKATSWSTFCTLTHHGNTKLNGFKFKNYNSSNNKQTIIILVYCSYYTTLQNSLIIIIITEMIHKHSEPKPQKNNNKGGSIKKPYFDINKKKLNCFVKRKDEVSVSPHPNSNQLHKIKEHQTDDLQKHKNTDNKNLQDSPDLAKKAIDSVIKGILKHGIGEDWSQTEVSSARSLSPQQNSFSSNNIWKSDWSSQSMSQSFYSDKGYSPFGSSNLQKISGKQYNLSTHPSSINVSFQAYNCSQYQVFHQNQQCLNEIFEIVYQQILTDGRTTVMIKNIPNKYGLAALQQEINASHQGSYDFLYIPFDYQSSCNMGYAFINFLNTEYLKQFFTTFNFRKWLKFKSEKICELKYARLQGRSNLIEHFQKSKVIQKAKPYRPIIKEYASIKKIIAKQRTQNNN